MTGVATVMVNPAAATHFIVTAPGGTTAGTPFTVTVQATDAFNNQATGYRGTIHFTSTDGAATLPANYTFTAGDQGSHAFTNGVTLRTVGNRTVTATDTVTNSITGSATVNVTAPSAATHFAIDAPTNVSLGNPFNITVTALDANNQVVTTYTGTVHFTSSDSAATLPADYTFTSSDHGAHFFKGTTLRTGGTQTITVTDTGNSSVTGTVSVNARRLELEDLAFEAAAQPKDSRSEAVLSGRARDVGPRLAPAPLATANSMADAEQRLVLALAEAAKRIEDGCAWDLFV
jgi:hypothetical protein